MIKLQPFRRDDFARLISWVSSPEFLLQWAGPMFTYPLDEAQLGTYWQSTVTESPVRRVYTVVDSTSSIPVGHIELNHIDERNRSATVSRVLVDPDLQGRGYGTHMVREILKIAFEKMHLHRVDLFVFDFNAPAISAYERAGFEKEGYLRDARRIGDEYWSLVHMSVLEDRWRVNEDIRSERETLGFP